MKQSGSLEIDCTKFSIRFNRSSIQYDQYKGKRVGSHVVLVPSVLLYVSVFLNQTKRQFHGFISIVFVSFSHVALVYSQNFLQLN